MKGILNVCSNQTIVLFDSSATHSFICPSFAIDLNEEISMLDNPLMVLTPIGEVYSVSKVLRGCEVRIENEVFLVNLVVLDILEFDMILGMD